MGEGDTVFQTRSDSACGLKLPFPFKTTAHSNRENNLVLEAWRTLSDNLYDQ